MNYSEKLIIALDFPSAREAVSWVKRLVPTVKYFKVGKQLFVSEGPEIVRDIQKAGGEVFLDLKFHDIPNTAYEATKAAMKLAPFMLNVHLLGGTEMMKAAREAVDQYASPQKKPLLIGVTILTSHSAESLNELGFRMPLQELVIHYARLAKKTGLDGVVCSVSDVAAIKREIGKDFVAVTPGVRLAGENVLKDDQKRTATAESALKDGADYLVIGRSLFQSQNPLERLKTLFGGD